MEQNPVYLTLESRSFPLHLLSLTLLSLNLADKSTVLTMCLVILQTLASLSFSNNRVLFVLESMGRQWLQATSLICPSLELSSFAKFSLNFNGQAQNQCSRGQCPFVWYKDREPFLAQFLIPNIDHETPKFLSWKEAQESQWYSNVSVQQNHQQGLCIYCCVTNYPKLSSLK